MKCSVCGFVDIAMAKTCRYCGSSLQQSMLIPFPAAQVTPTTQADDRSQPDWRAELRQRIEAIRARREMAAAMQRVSTSQPTVSSKPESLPKPTNPMVAAALRRIKHTANQEPNGSATSLPNQRLKDELLLSLGTKLPTSPDPTHPRETCSQTEPGAEGTPEPSSRRIRSIPSEVRNVSDSEIGNSDFLMKSSYTTPTEPIPSPQPKPQSPDHNQLPSKDRPPDNGDRLTGMVAGDHITLDEADLDETSTAFDPSAGTSGADSTFTNASARPSPQPAGRSEEFQLQTATTWQRLRSGVIDGLVMVLVNVPFIALVELNEGNFADPRVQIVLGCIALILYVFYLTLMLVTAGQTIGMMAMGIVAVDARSLDLPSFTQAWRRAVGLLLAVLPVMVGCLFSVLDPRRRSLADVISGTTVKRAFVKPLQVRVPWLYHHIRS